MKNPVGSANDVTAANNTKFFSSNSIHLRAPDIIEEGSSLTKLEKLASNLGEATKPETTGVKMPEGAPTFSFSSMENGFTAAKSVKESISASKTVSKSPVRSKGPNLKKSLWNGCGGPKAQFK